MLNLCVNSFSRCIFGLINVIIANGWEDKEFIRTRVSAYQDMGVLADSLPAYYGLAGGVWKHWCRAWDVDYDWMVSRLCMKSGYKAKEEVDILHSRYKYR